MKRSGMGAVSCNKAETLKPSTKHIHPEKRGHHYKHKTTGNEIYVHEVGTLIDARGNQQEVVMYHNVGDPITKPIQEMSLELHTEFEEIDNKP